MRTARFRQGLMASWSGFILLIVFWQLISSVLITDSSLFPGPVQVMRSTMQNLALARLLQHLGISLQRIGLGFAIGAVSGIILGVTCGWYRTLGSVLRTPIELVRPVPPLAWIPLAIIWLGLGESSKVFIIFLGAFFPIFTNTYKGMTTIEPNIIRSAQMLGLKGSRLLLRVVVPATLPDIATGIRVGWSYSFGCMVAAELIAAQSGLGYLIMHARELGITAIIVFGIVLIGLTNLITDYLIQELILKRRLRWHFLGTEQA